MLELQRVVKHYDVGRETVRAVDDVSLSVAAQEMVAVCGPSGSGKTTLLLLVAALLAQDAGSITFDGQDLARMSTRETSEYLLSDVGFVFQNFRLMPRVSALENAARKLIIGGAGVREACARATPWLERVGLQDRAESTPEQLSGGERQRVAVARALAGEPRLILADEPTGNLDSARSQEIMQLLRAVARESDACVLLVTHDLDAAAAADRQFTLRDGKLLEAEGMQVPDSSPAQAAAARQRG